MLAQQLAAKAKDEAARKAITDEMEAIYADTKASVEAKLNRLETEVDAMFDAGIEAAFVHGLSEQSKFLRFMFAIHDLTPGDDRLVWMTAFPALVPPESLTACFSPWPRNEFSPLAGLKCASYSENLIALDQARRKGFDETIFLNTAGHLCEAATANLFLVKDGVLFTPSLASGCLPGITREVVIELAGEEGIPCEVGALTLADLQAADEVFLTSSTIGAVPLSRLGDRVLDPGPVTRRLREAVASQHGSTR